MNPYRAARETQVFQLYSDRRVFRHHFFLSTHPPLESFPPSIIITRFIQVLIDTPSIEATSKDERIYMLVQFPPEVFKLNLLPAGAA